MTENPKIEFTIEGDEVRPDTVPLKDLATVALTFERAVRSNYLRGDVGDEDGGELYLIGLREGCVAMEMTGADPVVRSALDVRSAIAEGDLRRLPSKSRRAIESLVEYGRPRGWSYSLGAPDIGRESVTFSAESILTPVPIRSLTSIHGRLLRVGGREKEPRATLRTPEGEITAVLRNQEMATDLGKRLYQWIELQGEATYDARDWSIIRFLATEVGSYELVPVARAFEEVSAASAGRWDEVDPEEFVRQLRSDDAA